MVEAGEQDPGQLDNTSSYDDMQGLIMGSQAILEDVDAGVLTDVLSFVRETSPQTYVLIPVRTTSTL
jgi:hypothetical protein